jgi:hypothetical protein
MLRSDDHVLSKNDGIVAYLAVWTLAICYIISSPATSIFNSPIATTRNTTNPIPSIMQTSKLLSRTSLLSPKPAISLSLSRTFTSSPLLSQRISDLIKHDHDELRTYKDNILNAKDDDEKVRWQNQFTWELARHSIAEELVVYPAMEKNW